MFSQPFRHFTLMTAFVASLVACGGSGTQVAGGGIGGTGISQGSITAFGSVWVNGVEFDTSNATITRDGSSVSQSDLALGMVVTVDGTVNSDGVSGTATRVSYTNELVGPISNITTSSSIAATLTVLGQSVIVDDLTKITKFGSPAAIADLMNGETVEVSGFLSASGIRASYIEVKSASDQVELRGMVSAVNGSIISIGSQEIDISAVPSYTATVGDFIEVKASVPSTGSVLQAIGITKKARGLGAGTSDQAEFEGFVTSVTSSSDFMVDGQAVQTTSQTVYSGGAASDIRVGTRLEINGSLSSGVLVATRISFEDKLTLEGNIASYDAATNSITLDSYPGIPIKINDVLTEGASTTPKAGDYIKIRGRQSNESDCTSTSCVLATELDQVTSGGSGGGGTGGTSTESHVQVKTVDVTNQTITTVLGSTLDLSTFSTFSGTDSADHEITDLTGFLNSVKAGDLVHLKGTINGSGVITWTSIELED